MSDTSPSTLPLILMSWKLEMDLYTPIRLKVNELDMIIPKEAAKNTDKLSPESYKVKPRTTSLYIA
jgi:hypothetical protein